MSAAMFQKKKWAGIQENQDFICIKTFSGYTLTTSDPLGKEYLLELTVDNIDLGRVLNFAHISEGVA